MSITTTTNVSPHKHTLEALRTLQYVPAHRENHVYTMKFKVNNYSQVYDLIFRNRELYSVSSQKKNDFTACSVSRFVFEFFAAHHSTFND